MLDLEFFDKERLKRHLLFVPCATKDGLRLFIKEYMDLDFPDIRIDDESTGSPMDTLWEIYHAGVTGRADFRRVMMYASRDSYKTLGAAVLEVLALIHMRRSVVHMAAIEQQAQKAQEYVKAFLDKPYFRDFKVGDNKRQVMVKWYTHRATGAPITSEEWDVLPGDEKTVYEPHQYYIKIIVNTMQSSNSDHVPFMVVDEVDIVRFPKAYEEAKLIPSPTPDSRKFQPITLLTSTRKSSFGLVQKELDGAEKTGLNVRHWNILDITSRCPDDRHLPSKPRIPIYRSDATLQALSEADFKDVLTKEPKRAKTFVRDEGYEGCLRNCKIFAACRGRLAQQRSTAGLLKPIEDTVGKFLDNSPDMAQAQLLCWKPSSEGLIYPHLSEAHRLTANEMYERITGEKPIAEQNKESLMGLLISRGAKVVAGMDFGFTHNFAVCTGAVDGRRLFMLDAIEVPGLELMQKIELCDRRIKRWNPTIFPDPAYPADIKTFGRYGYRMLKFDKDVYGGIEAVRSKVLPAGGREPEMFFLRGEEGCDILFKRLSEYHWTTDAAGNLTDIPDEKDDDLCDAMRYLAQNMFGANRGKVVVAPDAGPKPVALSIEGAPQYLKENWMGQKIEELTGGENKEQEAPIKRGGFFAAF